MLNITNKIKLLVGFLKYNGFNEIFENLKGSVKKHCYKVTKDTADEILIP